MDGCAVFPGEACLERKSLGQDGSSSLDPVMGRAELMQTDKLGFQSFFVNSVLNSLICYRKRMIRKKITSIFFFLYKRILIVDQFETSKYNKSVFIHGDIVSIYTYVQYKNAQKAYVPAAKLHCTRGKQPGFSSWYSGRSILCTACRQQKISGSHRTFYRYGSGHFSLKMTGLLS